MLFEYGFIKLLFQNLKIVGFKNFQKNIIIFFEYYDLDYCFEI